METVSSGTQKARKIHKCDSCFREIKINDIYHSSFVVDGGQSWTWKEHSVCHRVSNLLYTQGFHGEEEYTTPSIDYMQGDFGPLETLNPQLYQEIQEHLTNV